MKTKEELTALKEEVETLNKKLAELSEEELKAVTGGYVGGTCGENNGIIIDNSYISPDPTYGAGIGGGSGYSPENNYGGICGQNGVHYDQIVLDPIYPEK